MSFVEQERALFDLLFDRHLREQFCANGTKALSKYRLNESERADFDTVRPDALMLDATMRTSLILSRLCRELPLTFALASSLQEGKIMLQSLIDGKTMRTAPEERVVLFATRLREGFAGADFNSVEERAIAIALLDTESNMAWTAAKLKRSVMQGEKPPAKPEEIPQWANETVKLADYVSASIIPSPYLELKQTLCPRPNNELWSYLSRRPLSASQRFAVLKNRDPRLFVARARITHMSYCSPSTGHTTVELAEGFSPLFQHLDGNSSINQILHQLQQAGAPEHILQGVYKGFEQLWKSGMFVPGS